MTYTTTFNPSQYDLTVPRMSTSCGHKHRSIATAEKCAYQRFSEQPIGSPVTSTFHSDGSPLTRAERDEVNGFWAAQRA